MQRDLDLLASLTDTPILRIYGWTGSWASYGYFQKEPDVRAHFGNAEISLVRRPTGGGIVDHRHDQTYSLFFPKNHPLAKIPRSQSYSQIHQLLQQALPQPTILASSATTGPACFTAPVPGDLLNEHGQKIAGAAQRRTRHGLLHQGSILSPLDPHQLVTALENTL